MTVVRHSIVNEEIRTSTYFYFHIIMPCQLPSALLPSVHQDMSQQGCSTVVRVHFRFRQLKKAVIKVYDYSLPSAYTYIDNTI